MREEQSREGCDSGSAIHLTIEKSLLRCERACLAPQLSPLQKKKKKKQKPGQLVPHFLSTLCLCPHKVRFGDDTISILIEALTTRALRKVLIRYLSNWSGTPGKVSWSLGIYIPFPDTPENGYFLERKVIIRLFIPWIILSLIFFFKILH